MPRYAGGKYALGISDRSGRAYPLTSMIKEWNGLLVGRDEFEAKDMGEALEIQCALEK